MEEYIEMGKKKTYSPVGRPCKLHTGPKGGKFRMHRKKGGGTRRVYE